MLPPASLSATLPYGLDLSGATPLPGEVNRNYLLRDKDETPYLLKVYPGDHGAAQLDLQSALLDHLRRHTLPFAVPELLAEVVVRDGDRQLTGRLFSYLPGRPLGMVNPLTDELYHDWGRCCGTLSATLANFDHPAAHRSYHWDPLLAPEILPAAYAFFTAEQRELVQHFMAGIEGRDFSALPHSVNYNDAHEQNLLSEDGTSVTGLIDFDDAVRTATICELAIGCAYAAMNVRDPLGVLRAMVGGYTSVYSARAVEIDALYWLIVSRLLLTVAHAATNREAHPDNPYLTVSERDAWSLLERLRSLPPVLVTAHLRSAARLPVHPNTVRFTRWCAGQRAVSPVDLPPTGARPLDLGVGSETLGSTHHYTDAVRFNRRMRTVLEQAGTELAVGGYGEVRPVYEGPAFRGEGNTGRRHRSVHLGLDFWTPVPGGAVRAMLAGTVVTAGQDATPGGYGYVILLRHQPTANLQFYTLYGHLSRDSVRTIGAGTQVQAGEVIGTIGSHRENGGWPPHLHVQLLLDDLGYGSEFPGVAYPGEAAVWLGLCPDPRQLIGPDLPAETPPTIDAAELLDRRRQRLGYGLSLSYRRPLYILRGWMQELYDHRGRRYLDTVNNVAHVGHGHPEVVEAAGRQAAVLNTNSRYLHPAILAYAEALVATLPDELSVVHFVNSGSEANELALRMARTVTRREEVLAFEMGYHGNTGGTIAVSSYKFARKGGAGRPPRTHLLPYPDMLRKRNLDPLPHLPPDVLTFIHESILSCAGQLPLPPGYLAAVYARIRGAGGVCIADEVQTGLGRTGNWWSFEAQGVVPDIVTMGKPLGNGHPLGAVVCTPRVARAFATGMEYFNTFGGNPVSSATGLAVLHTVRNDGLRERARETGSYLAAGLGDLGERHPLIADVRGSGLFLGVELCHFDLAPATAQASYVVNRMRDLGILTSVDGPHENVLKIKPPLCFGREDADELLYYLDRVLGEDRAQS